jgi:hypothetical protein
MNNTKANKPKPVRLNNGLTGEQVESARAVLAKVNISEVCRTVNVKRSILENVLRDESPRIDELKKVLVEANRVIKKREHVLKSLPL